MRDIFKKLWNTIISSIFFIFGIILIYSWYIFEQSILEAKISIKIDLIFLLFHQFTYYYIINANLYIIIFSNINLITYDK